MFSQFWQGKDKEEQVQTLSLSFSTEKAGSVLFKLFEPQVYHVVAVTIANGGDNISIYVPLFANSNLFSLSAILIVFLG